jgi:RHS repeat-associated protein
MNRLLYAGFYKEETVPYTGAYDESLAYDLNGNITSLYRTTGDTQGNLIEMDELTYTYQDSNSNQLKNVSDAVSSGNSMGFVDGNTNPGMDDYQYDANGNMIRDNNKGIAEIQYNHLNLPTKIIWSNNKYISYTYNAAGQKVSKSVRENDSIKVVDYLDGFQYAGKVLQFFPHAEGYVKATPGAIAIGGKPTNYFYNYIYNYTDHLGNVRLSYSKDPQTGVLEILDENHYYPFGLKHEVYVSANKKEFDLLIGGGIDGGIGEVALKEVLKTEYLYKYNGKEWQDELNLSWYDYHARNYDPAIGKWMNPDPLAEIFMDASPYNYALNNPIFFIDPDGMEATVNVGYDREVAFDSFSGSVQASYFDGGNSGDTWGNPKDEERLTKSVNNRIKNLEKDNKKIQGQIDKGGLSEKKLGKLNSQLAENNEKISLLDLVLKDIKEIANAPDVYILSSSHKKGFHYVYKSDRGIIIMGSSRGMQLHEIRHIGQSLAANRLRFDKKTGKLKNIGRNKKEMRENEIEAYKVGYSFDNNYPIGGVDSLNGINHKTLLQIQNQDGRFLYENLKD